MAETTEQLIMRMAFDGSDADRGMAAMRIKTQKEALEYQAFWARVIEQKAATEAAAAKATAATVLATHAANQAALLKITEARMAREAAIQAGLAAGSVPENMLAGAAGTAARGLASKYVFNEAGKLVSVSGKAIKEIETVGMEAHGLGGMFREALVMFREFLRGNYTRMIGSFTRLLQFAGGAVGAIALPALAVIAGTAAITGPSAWRAWKAHKAEEQSTKDEGKKEEYEAELLRKRIEDLQRAGLVSDKEANAYQERLKNGDVAGVAISTNKFLKTNTAEELAKKAETAKEVARIQQEAQRAELEADRETLPLKWKKFSLEIERRELLEKMNGLAKDSVEYAQAQVEVSRLQRQENQIDIEMAKEKKRIDEEHDKEKLELQKQYHEEEKKAQKVEGEIADIDSEVPTISMLAGRNYTSRLDKAYGKGGRYDLESGNGPFAAVAQAAELAAKQQMWDVMHGNAEFQYNDVTGKNELMGGAAYEDKKSRLYAENLLAAAGLDTPAMKQARMEQNLTDINKNIHDLLDKASHDGIVINTDQTQ